MSASLSSSGDLLADRRYAYAMASAEEGDHAAAIDLLEQTLALVPHWAPAWLALGDAYLACDQADAAIAAWQKALEAAPDDRLGAKPRLARLGVLPALDSVGEPYIRALFDDYADRFDRHLREGLMYSGPEIILDAITQAEPEAHYPRVLDLGCGTGLMGEAIRAHQSATGAQSFGMQWLGGCDLSPSMIARARAKGIYDWLAPCSLLDALATHQADLIVAADVLVYVGDLAPVFAACYAALPKAGLCAFTVQKGDAPISLGADLRYAHSADQLKQWAQDYGFTCAVLADCTTRYDRGVPVPGLVCVLRKG